MMTPNGLSPRVTKGQHRRSRSATNKEEIFSASGGGGSSNTKSATPGPSASHGRFFHDPAAAGAAVAPARPAPSTLPSDFAASSPSPSCKGHPKQQKKSSTAIRLVAMMATASAVLLCTRAATAAASPGGGVRAVAAAGEEAQQNRCAERIERRRGLGVPPDREQCAGVLPDSFMMQHGGGGAEDGRDSESWLVSVHVDRAPSSVDLSKRLRGAVPLHRSLPHQYYVRAMEASLHSIAVAEPGAHVDVAIFSEGQWGGMVDEMGLPLYWDVAGETCDDLGLHCTQHVVLLNERTAPESSQSLDCIAASDLFIASESKFSRAGAVLSDHVKVLTDRWEMDEEEMMVALNPATTIAGMPDSQRQLLRTLVADYHECSSSST
ncbi:unnamed protein product [Ectocarpus sp. CCAP 1310/34]|nr:unnamed protein product [Ectocarpus sp. CCAP 1310/34]